MTAYDYGRTSRPQGYQGAQESPPAAASPPQPDEAVLVKRARQGDLGAYDELIRRYQERIYATVYHMTSNHEDATDLARGSVHQGLSGT
jgi:RNA polymerase sigma-70 factor (ECF subfamily)